MTSQYATNQVPPVSYQVPTPQGATPIIYDDNNDNNMATGPVRGSPSAYPYGQKAPSPYVRGHKAREDESPAQDSRRPSSSSSGRIRVVLRKPMGIVFEPMYDPRRPVVQKGVRICDLPRSGAAAMSRKLKVGDELISINEKPMRRLAFDEVMDFIIAADADEVNLIFRRPRKDGAFKKKSAKRHYRNDSSLSFGELMEFVVAADPGQLRSLFRRPKRNARRSPHQNDTFMDLVIDSFCANADAVCKTERGRRDDYASEEDDDERTVESQDDSTYVSDDRKRRAEKNRVVSPSTCEETVDDTPTVEEKRKRRHPKAKKPTEERERERERDGRHSNIQEGEAVMETPMENNGRPRSEPVGLVPMELPPAPVPVPIPVPAPAPVVNPPITPMDLAPLDTPLGLAPMSTPLGLTPSALPPVGLMPEMDPMESPPIVIAPQPEPLLYQPNEEEKIAPISEVEYDGDFDHEADVSAMLSVGGPSLFIERQRQIVPSAISDKFGFDYPVEVGFTREQAIQNDPLKFYAHVVKKLLEEHEPEKTRLLDKLLTKYKGREDHLIQKLSVRYTRNDGGTNQGEKGFGAEVDRLMTPVNAH